MKTEITNDSLVDGTHVLTCSSHEKRCLGLLEAAPFWKPQSAIVFHYSDPNERRERNHAEMLRKFNARCEVSEIPFNENEPAASFRDNREILIPIGGSDAVIVDISVFTKRHLIMLLRWLDDHGLWDKTELVYSEPLEYEVDDFLPLSFGVRRLEEIPGLPAAPDPSRPIHAVLFLGFEGDRALATYELLEPVRTTLIVADPPSQERWRGLAEHFNRDLIALVGEERMLNVDAIDPEDTVNKLRGVLGDETEWSDEVRMLCPMGTKPQAVGCYLYEREAVDPPVIMYTGPMRHNHQFFSRDIGRTWKIKGIGV